MTSGRTLVKTGVDLVMSVLGEIPGVGGVVDLGVTAFVAFNGLAKNLMIGTRNVMKMVTIANKLTGDVLNPIDDAVQIFHDLHAKAEGVYRNIDDRLEKLNETYKEEQNDPSDPRLIQPNPVPEVDTRFSQPEPPPSTNNTYVDNRLTQEPQGEVASPVAPREVASPVAPREVASPVASPVAPKPPPVPPPLPPRPNTGTQKKVPKASTNKRKKKTQKKKKRRRRR